VRRKTIDLVGVLVGVALLAAGCFRDAGAAERRRVEVQTKMKQLLSTRLSEWKAASTALRDAAPITSGRGWDARQDAVALAAMRKAWTDGRTAYELVEGAIAPLFPESDVATDARYDAFSSTLGHAGDPDPFDGEGVIGMHAIERVLWADAVPPPVIKFEQGLPGYRRPSFPATEAQARAFKERLVGRLVADVDKLVAELAPLELDLAFAFRGLLDLAAEQKEKVVKAATGEEESRYAQATMRDLRANLRGCREAYEIFRPWLLAARGGGAVDQQVTAAFGRLDASYAAVKGDAFPHPPTSWSSLNPAASDRGTAFGRLFSVVEKETDPAVKDSLVAALGGVAEKLDLPAAILR
jgi:iron uptake system component EfeO